MDGRLRWHDRAARHSGRRDVSLTGYFLDGATQRGITYDALQAFEKALNEKLNTGNLKVHVAIIPVARDQLIPALLDGRADIAAANLTITPERQKLVDFSEAGWTGVSELVVTGPSAPPLSELDDLSGKKFTCGPRAAITRACNP